jgi:hypothetical protein
VIALDAGALILGLAVIGLLFLLDRPEDVGKVTPGWMRRHETGRDQR